MRKEDFLEGKPLNPLSGKIGPERKKWRRIFLSLAAILTSACICLIAFDLLRSQARDEISHLGESIGSPYRRYAGKIYLNIAFQGYYLVSQADAASFTSLSRGSISPLAKDKNAVYCGSRTIPNLDPEHISFVAMGYISDGRDAWYCSTEQDNPDYRWWHDFTKRGDSDSPDKPRRRDFHLTKLEGVHAARLKTIGIGYAFDDEIIFHEGIPIPGSDAKTMQGVLIGEGRLRGIESDFYLRDASRVYYNGQVLAGAHAAFFTSLQVDRAQYGFDGKTGRYYAGSTAFPEYVGGKDANALQLLLADRERANHELFYNGNGIWFWDYQDKGLKHACSNPFQVAYRPEAKPAALASGFWADDGNTFFARSAEVWRKGRSDSSLRERATEVLMLSGVTQADWQHVEEVKRDIWTQGILWRAKGINYFSPSLGNGHGLNDALYQVPDVQKLKDFISQKKEFFFSKNDVLRPVKAAHTICRASSYYPGILGF